MSPLFRERLRPDHDLTAFSSGDATLDHWIHRWPSLQIELVPQGRMSGWTRSAPSGPTSRCCHMWYTELTCQPNSGEEALTSSPPSCARLALAEKLHGQPERWGTVLLLDALDVAVTAIRRVGGRLIVVDAIDDKAKSFYEHHDFKPVSSDPYRLVLKASDAAKALDVPWP